VIPSWLQTLQRLVPEETAGHTFRVIAVNRPHVMLRDVKFLVFADDEPEPRWVLRCHHDVSTTDHEELVLRELQRHGFHVQPEPMGRDRCEDMHAQLLRFCKGRQGSLKLWRSQDALWKLMWELAKVQLGLAAWARSRFDARPLEGPDLCRVIQGAGYVGDETRLARTLDAARDRLVSAKAPELPQHGDCCTVNILWNAGEIRILDWEHFAFGFEPFMDAWTFVLSICQDSGDSEGASLFTAGPNATAAGYAIRRYASNVGLPAELGLDVFPLVLARSIQLNTLPHRVTNARRLCRTLSAYVAAPSSFMSGLRSSKD
jgi:aminoglycoside phosphotransferase (APT) family kinase protein